MTKTKTKTQALIEKQPSARALEFIEALKKTLYKFDDLDDHEVLAVVAHLTGIVVECQNFKVYSENMISAVVRAGIEEGRTSARAANLNAVAAEMATAAAPGTRH